MRFKNLYMLISLTLGISCSAQEVKSDLEEYELRGEVKSVIEKEYDAFEAFGNLQKGNLRDSTIISFHKNGRLNNIVSYENGVIANKISYQYQSNLSICNDSRDGELYRVDTTYYNERGKIKTLIEKYKENVWRYEYKYNDKGQIAESSCYENNEWKYKEYYEYDKSGKLLQLNKVYDLEEPLYSAEYYTYNEEGKVIQILSEDEKGRYIYSKKTSYNGEDFASYVEEDSKYYNFKRYYTYEYDSRGNYMVKYIKFINYMNGQYTESYRLVERTIVYY